VLGPFLVPGREGVLGHHPANRGVPKFTHSQVKKSVSELVDHTLYIKEKAEIIVVELHILDIMCLH